MPSRIYLDNNATTRLDPQAAEVMARVQREAFGNPGSRHAEGRRARQVLESSRERIAELLQAEPDEVVFTSGGTEANHLAVHGLTAGRRSPWVACPAGDHPSLVEPCQFVTSGTGRWHALAIDRLGMITESAWAELPWAQLHLVACALAHNETGVIQNFDTRAHDCAAHGVPLHFDAVQAVGKMPVRFHALGCTTLACAAHKFHGPRGIGALLVRRGVRLSPVTLGGHQEEGRRAGTECVVLAAGMAEALERAAAALTERTACMRILRDELEFALGSQFPSSIVLGRGAERLPNTLCIAFPGLSGEALLIALDLAGIACSMGSACASGSAEPAPVLVNMGCPPDVSRAAIRFSLSAETTQEEIRDAIPRICDVVRSVSARAESSQ